jgi:hypothetical protein
MAATEGGGGGGGGGAGGRKRHRELDDSVLNAIAGLEARLSKEIASVKSELTKEIASVKSELTTEIASMKSELTEKIESAKSELKQDIQSLKEQLAIQLPTIRRNEVEGLVPSDRSHGGVLTSVDIVHGAPATYTCIKHDGRVFVLGSAHRAYYYGEREGRNLMFVVLPRSVVAAGVEAVYRHKDLAKGSPRRHDFVIVEVSRVPEGVHGQLAGWPLHQTEWEVGVMNGDVFGISPSGEVQGNYLTVPDPHSPVGVFVEKHPKEGHCGTLLFGDTNAGAIPLGVYSGLLNEALGRPRGICVPIPPLDSLELVRTLPIPPVKQKPELYECRVSPKETRYCLLTCNGKQSLLQDNGQESHTGVLVTDSHSYVGRCVSGAAKAAKAK